ncbi:MAG TPA: alpha/beta fold hydrolase [Azospirillaceae bacterium]|nr:alpha/beta fold hydrolase [Azospirillaceae bacterium]HRQ82197.1 alpha/beta fold hydrolase [Azospirillaceae bacterium]
MATAAGGAAGSGDAMIVESISIPCRDGFQLAATLRLPASTRAARGLVIINCATGVAARYYRRYAEFLTGHGLAALTWDYRGVGDSRPENLRGCRIRWRDWGELDFDAVVNWARARDPSGLVAVVGHSIGGFLPGFAAAAPRVDRYLTVGAQYAYWRDYAAHARARLWIKWHVAMPALTALWGYFPGRRLGWLEDLPAGVAYEWSFRRARMERSYPLAERAGVLARFAAVRAPILALAASDDEYATLSALRRGLAYYIGAERKCLSLSPEELGREAIGHFSLFHVNYQEPFWPTTISWLRDGVNPWPWALHLPAEAV